MSSFPRAILAICVGIIVVLFLIWTMPDYKIVPRGIVLPIQGGQSKHTGEVQIYDEFNMPFDSTNIGFISMMYHTTTQTSADREIIFDAAKQLAAAAGGNGLVIGMFGFTSEGVAAPLASSILRGQVIYTH